MWNKNCSFKKSICLRHSLYIHLSQRSICIVGKKKKDTYTPSLRIVISLDYEKNFKIRKLKYPDVKFYSRLHLLGCCTGNFLEHYYHSFHSWLFLNPSGRPHPPSSQGRIQHLLPFGQITPFSIRAPQHPPPRTLWPPLLTRGAAKGSRVFCSRGEVLFC